MSALRCYLPLIPEPHDQGDPFVLHTLPGSAAYRYYAYTTGMEEITGSAFRTYGSNDLAQWQFLGFSLEGSPRFTYWAPAVYQLPTNASQFVMLYSHSIARGPKADHIGHRIYRAEADRPEGPFKQTGEVHLEGLDFAIDPDVMRHADGTLRLSFAADYVQGQRIGTGLMEVRITEDLQTTVGSPKELARPSFDWQVFHPARSLPWKAIPDVDWTSGAVVCWHCIEGPSNLVSQTGRRIVLYSGGCYEGLYAIGILAEEQGSFRDLSCNEATCLIASMPEKNLFAPGHCSTVDGPDGRTYLVFHARYGSLTAPRQMSIALLSWNDQGLPYLER